MSRIPQRLENKSLKLQMPISRYKSMFLHYWSRVLTVFGIIMRGVIYYDAGYFLGPSYIEVLLG